MSLPPSIALHRPPDRGAIVTVVGATLSIALVTLLPPTRWAFGLLAAALLIAVLAVRPVWGLYLLLLVITVIPSSGVITLADYYIAAVDLYLIVFTALWVWHKAVVRSEIRITPLLVPITVTVLVRLASVFATPSLIVGSLISLLRYIEWLLVFVIVTDLARTREVVRLLGVFLAVVGLQTILSIGQISLGLLAGQTVVTRGGTLGHTGILLSWLQIYALLIAFSLSHHATVAWKRIAWWGYTAVLGVGLISTLSRSAWITAAVGFLLYHWLDRRASWPSKIARVARDSLTAVLALAVVFALNQLLIGAIVLRAATFTALSETYAWMERLTLWRVGLEMFVQHPILGVGTGNYVDLLAQVVGAEEARTAHNGVVAILSETGLLGFVAYLFFAVSVARIVYSDLWRHTGSRLYPLLLPLGSAIVAQLFADWISWTSFFVWSMLFLAFYVVLRTDVRENASAERLSAV